MRRCTSLLIASIVLVVTLSWAGGGLPGAGTARALPSLPLGVISTVAGDGTPTYSGDGGPANQASLSHPNSVALGGDGSLYIGDYANHRVRRVDAAGVISTVAGNGTPGYSGDGGPAVDASLGGPHGIAFDATGNLYIAEYGGHRVRKVSPGADGIVTGNADEIITPFAGGGSGCAGQTNARGDGCSADSAILSYPSSVATDSASNVYISEHGNHTIRKVNGLGTISTVAGNGAEGYSGDGGPASAASLKWPSEMAFDTSGALYIADHGNEAVRKVDVTGEISTFIVEPGDPHGVLVDATGNLYLTGLYSNLVRKVDSAGVVTTVAGGGSVCPEAQNAVGDGCPATSATLNGPGSLAMDDLGNLYIGDSYNHRVRVVALGIPDRDGDGVPDGSDDCPDEDARGFDADGDGCIDDLDNLYGMIDTLVGEGAISDVLANSLRAKLDAAMRSYTSSNVCAAVHELGALKNQIIAQTGKKVSQEAAAQLLPYITNVQNFLMYTSATVC